MYLKKIKDLLKERIGLNPESVGESSIVRAINHRMVALNLETQREYYKLLAESSCECNELIEEVVVPETWFFRNKTPFDALRVIVKRDVLPNLKSSEKIRILSIPCSTGEEPYSIAMALLEEGVNARRISIDAVDISKKALAKARRAIYGRNSFRDVDEQMIVKYFEKVRSGHHLIESVRNLVQFKLGNFLVGSLSPHPNYYDVIFCRNLLIYFNRDTQRAALEKLHRSLKDTGVLFVGHAETAQISRNDFLQYKHARSFAYVKKLGDHTTKERKQSDIDFNDLGLMLEKVPKEWRGVFKQFAQMPYLVAPKKPAGKSEEQTKKKQILPVRRGRKNVALESVEQLMGEGKFDLALKLCEKFLQSSPESADGYFLMGVIFRSSGDDKKSQSMLKKAIYLDPNHEQAISLSLHLAKDRGDTEAVTSYARRLQRVRNRQRR